LNFFLIYRKKGVSPPRSWGAKARYEFKTEAKDTPIMNKDIMYIKLSRDIADNKHGLENSSKKSGKRFLIL